MAVLADKDIDSTMKADWAAIMEKHAVEPDIDEPAPEGGENEGSAQESVATPAAVRNKDGTFAEKPKEPVVARESTSKIPAVKAPKDGAQPETEPAPAELRDVTRAPSTWKPTARADWEKLPPAARAEIHRREQDFLNGQREILPDAKFGKSINEVVAPYRMLIESEGGTPERAIGDLLRTAAQLRMGTPQQKVQLFANIAQQYGVDLSAFAPQIGQQPPQQPLQDPRVDQLIGQLNQERQQRAQAEQTSLEGAVTNWMDQKDAQGHPVRPYLGDVMNEMGALVPQIRQANPSLSHDQVLQQAYETATWGNPEIRALLLQAQGTGQVRAPDNQNRVREARRAASVNVPRRASSPAPGKPGTLEETIANTARELGLIT